MIGAALVSDVYSSLASHDQPQAMSLAQSLPEGPKRDSAIQSVINQIAQTDPANAMALAQQQPAGQKRDSRRPCGHHPDRAAGSGEGSCAGAGDCPRADAAERHHRPPSRSSPPPIPAHALELSLAMKNATGPQ